MEDERIDLSPLDPGADPVRWERLVGSITAAGVRARARRRPNPIVVQLAAWSRPLLAAAAAIALVLTPLLVALASRSQREGPQERTQTRQEPVPALLTWAMTNEAPASAELFDAFEGETRGQR